MLCISNTHSPAARRPLSHPLLHHTHTHTHTVPRKCVCVCVYAPPCQSIDWWLPEESESLSMRDNLSDAVYLSFPGSRSHTFSFACPFSSFPLPSPAAIHSDLMFMYLTMSSRSSVLLCQRSLLLLRFSLAVSASLVPPPQRPRDMNNIKIPLRKKKKRERDSITHSWAPLCVLLGGGGGCRGLTGVKEFARCYGQQTQILSNKVSMLKGKQH